MLSNRSRNLKLREFLIQLQLEWMSAHIRECVYEKVKDKQYWNKVKHFKQEKILDVSRKIGIDNIFNSVYERLSILDKCYTSKGLSLAYKDDEQKEALFSKDNFYYYKPGKEFVFNQEKVLLESIDFETKQVCLRCSNNSVKTAIFPEIKRSGI